MKSLGRICTVLMTLGLLSLATGQTPRPTSLPIGSATVADLKGDVSLHSPQGAVLNAQRGLLLAPESVIETAKGSILLDLQDGSQVLVKSNSRVVLKSPNEGKGFSLELLLGKIMAKVTKRLGETPSFRMGTPTAVITVRGTRFSVEVTKKQKTYVEVFEGIVEVQGLLPGSRPVLVRPGFSTSAQLDRGAEDPRQIGGQFEGMDRENDGFGLPRTGGRPGGEDQRQSTPTNERETEPH
jgi:ferric-dicitrate binding protein FerR (iron transport regulator)